MLFRSVVESNKLKPFTHALALGLAEGFPPRAVVNGFFVSERLPYSTRKQSVCMDGLEVNTALRTPRSQKRPALIERLVIPTIHGGKTRSLWEVNQSLMGTWWCLLLKHHGAGRNTTVFHPWESYEQRNKHVDK